VRVLGDDNVDPGIGSICCRDTERGDRICILLDPDALDRHQVRGHVWSAVDLDRVTCADGPGVDDHVVAAVEPGGQEIQLALVDVGRRARSIEVKSSCLYHL